MSDRIRRRVMTCEPTIAALTMLASPLVAYAQAPEPAPTPASFTAEQAARGRAEYERSCIGAREPTGRIVAALAQ